MMRTPRSEEASRRRLGRIELGGFRLFAVLGEGAFGTAYLAEQLGTDRRAVVKIAHAHVLEGPAGGAIRELFDAEIRAASRVHHPSLVTLYTAGTSSDGLPAMATEYIPGHTLSTAVAEGLTRSEVQACFEHVGAGLVALHREGIVHRDLSPENVMVVRSHEGVRAKIIDFGVAKLLDQASRDRRPIGTPRYMAPEQLRGEAETASDVYALGSLLHFALTGRELLDEVHDVNELLAEVSRMKRPASLRSLRVDVSPDEDALVQSLLSPHPAERPTAAQFLARWSALRGAEPGLDADVSPASEVRVAATSAGASASSGEALIGGGAEWLATLEDATTSRDRAAIVHAAQQLAALAEAAEATRLASLARALAAVAGTSATESLDALLGETRAAYRVVVRSFLSAS